MCNCKKKQKDLEAELANIRQNLQYDVQPRPVTIPEDDIAKIQQVLKTSNTNNRPNPYSVDTVLTHDVQRIYT